MAVSAIMLLLPPRWTDPLKHVTQLLVPAEDLFYSAGSAAAWSVAGLDRPDSTNTKQSNDSVGVQIAGQSAQIEQLQEENEKLRALRKETIPKSLPILSARVVARDIAATRDSVLVFRGSSRGVAWRDWVAARLFLDKGLASDVEQGQAVISQQCLLGRVEQVSPYMARVQLLTDRDSPRLEVRVAKMVNGRAQFIDYPCSVRGLGDNLMQIDGVEQRFAQPAGESEAADAAERIAVGDFVFTAAGQLGLPSAVAVGRVIAVEENPQKRLVYNVRVAPFLHPDELKDVYVIPLVQHQPISLKE